MNAKDIDLRREENRKRAADKYGPPFSVQAHRLLDAYLAWREDDERDPDAPPHVLDPDRDLRLTIDAEQRLAAVDDGHWYDSNHYDLAELARRLGGARPPPVRFDLKVDAKEHQRGLDAVEYLRLYFATRDEMDATETARAACVCEQPATIGPCWKVDGNADDWCAPCTIRQELSHKLKTMQRSGAALMKRMRSVVAP